MIEEFIQKANEVRRDFDLVSDLEYAADNLRLHLQGVESEASASVSSQWLSVAQRLLEVRLAHSPETLARLLPEELSLETSESDQLADVNHWRERIGLPLPESREESAPEASSGSSVDSGTSGQIADLEDGSRKVARSQTPSSLEASLPHHSSVLSPSSLVCCDGKSFDEGDIFPDRPYVGFCQGTDGTGYAYTVRAKDEVEAEILISEYFEKEYGGDSGQVMCYSPADLRKLADSLERPDHEFDVPSPP